MDDLDRLYHRLVQHVRDGAPHLLDQRFRLGDIAAHLVPYRHSRRELGFESIQQYEVALMRLAAGERGYLRAESAVQDALRRSLAEPQPDGSLLRAHADAAVALPPDALVRARLAGPEPGEARHATAPGTSPAVEPAAARPTPSAAHPPVAADLERAVVASSQAADAWTEPSRPGAATPAPARPTPAPTPAAATPAAATPAAATPAVAAEHRRPMTNPTQHPPSPAPAGEHAAATGGTCRYCGQALPEGRRITFCPYCGNNVTVLQCPACSTELEVGWKFCITCGRAMDDAAFAGDGGGGAPPGGAGEP